jgi:hypothetical protein
MEKRCDLCGSLIKTSEQTIENCVRQAQRLREERKEGGMVQNFGRYGAACIPEFYEVLLDTLAEGEKHCDTCIYIHFK